MISIIEISVIFFVFQSMLRKWLRGLSPWSPTKLLFAGKCMSVLMGPPVRSIGSGPWYGWSTQVGKTARICMRVSLYVSACVSDTTQPATPCASVCSTDVSNRYKEAYVRRATEPC